MNWGAWTLALGVAGAGLAAGPAARAQAPEPLRLTRRQAVDTALAHNPALAAAREQVEESRAQLVQDVAFPDLTLSADVTGQSSLVRPGSNTGHDLGVGLLVPFPTKFHWRGVMGHADLSAAEFAYQQQRQQTASQAAQAYDALLVTEQHRADLTEGRRLAQEFLDKTQARYGAGTVAGLDVIKARVDLAQADNDLIASERDLANARAALNRLMGRLLGADVEPAESLAVPAALPDLAALEDTARAERPELKSLAIQQHGASAASSLARSFWMPDLSVGLAQNSAAGTPSTYTTSVGFSLPLFFWNHTRGEVSQAQHRELELSAAYRDLEAQVDQDVRTTYAAAATALRQAIFLRDQLLPEARRAYQVALVSYGLGGSSALDVLDARRTLLDAESQYADALGAANDARADLERAIGRPLEFAAGDPTHER
ncbi:MAG TPA: TolC family protein [Vicinamibacteria bacterium]|nr:TolC family protein [Vicinamibacteria bacterium]